ncbi:MAG: hypothetical protein LBQ03_02335 [Puniceicoccales bacterium]|jgi:beta-lactamase superfamily II metal-dependent hydrolase|nr:hypothetical protein [Puniceicoccales bacterium]
MRYFFPFFLLLLLKNILPSIASADLLETYIFSVGQGSFVLMKHGSQCLVVDIGSGIMGKNPLQQYTSKMEKKGRIYRKLESIGIKDLECMLLVTHNHSDHFCLFPQFKEMTAKAVNVPGNFYGRRPSLAPDFWRSFSKQITPIPIDGTHLGEDINICCLLPTRNARKDHEKNLIVFVKYENVLFILPGDADSDYLELNAKAFVNELKNQAIDCSHCCIVLPHHGSNGALALPLSAQRILSENGCSETIFIISSDPEERDHLPRSAVLVLLPDTPETVEHSYSYSYYHNGRKNLKKKQKKLLPLYL